MPLIHQRHTCNNNPFQILASNDYDDEDTVVASNCSPHLPPPSLPSSNNPRNPPKRPLTRQVANQPTRPPSTLLLSCLSEAPSPRVLAIPSIITANTPRAPHIHIHELRPTPSKTHSKPPTITNSPAHALPIVEPDDEQDKVPTMRAATPLPHSTQIITNRTPCNISRQALYHVIDLGFTNTPNITAPHCLAQNQYPGPIIKTEEYCNGIVHPVTNEMITNYRKLINDPLLKDLWIKAMSKELHHLAQGCDGISTQTYTILFLSHADICNIPKD